MPRRHRSWRHRRAARGERVHVGAGPRMVASGPRLLLRPGERSAARHGAVLPDCARAVARPRRLGDGHGADLASTTDNRLEAAARRADRCGGAHAREPRHRVRGGADRHVGDELRCGREPLPVYRDLRHRGHPGGSRSQYLPRSGVAPRPARSVVARRRGPTGHAAAAARHRTRRHDVGKPHRPRAPRRQATSRCTYSR